MWSSTPITSRVRMPCCASRAVSGSWRTRAAATARTWAAGRVTFRTASEDKAAPPETQPTPTVRFPHSGQWRAPAAGASLDGAQVVRISRAPENDVVVGDLRVSRQHAELRIAGGVHEIVDVGGRFGTYVNGRLVQRPRVSPDDLIGIGTSTFQLVGDTLTEYADTGEVCLQAHGLTVTVGDGKVLLDQVSFPVGEKCQLAIIGPSGSGKSTLMRALTGLRPADQGMVTYDGR